MKRLVRHAMFAAALVLLAAATALDCLQWLEPGAHYYFYAARWMGTGLTLGFFSCAWYWSETRFDPLVGDKGPGLQGLLMLGFYGASWAVRKLHDRHLDSTSAFLSGLGLLALIVLMAHLGRQFRLARSLQAVG